MKYLGILLVIIGISGCAAAERVGEVMKDQVGPTILEATRGSPIGELIGAGVTAVGGLLVALSQARKAGNAVKAADAIILGVEEAKQELMDAYPENKDKVKSAVRRGVQAKATQFGVLAYVNEEVKKVTNGKLAGS